MSDFMLSLITFTTITVMGVVSIFPLTGLTGLFSFGQAAYMAVGAYIAGIAAVRLELSLLPCILIGVATSGLVALIVGIPTLKLRKDYFALMSLGLGEAITAILRKFSNITGGAAGLSNIPKRVSTLAIIIAAVVLIALVAFFKNSSYGRMSLAIKTDELAAKSFGIDVFRHKLKVYLFTSMIAGFTGTLYAFFITFIDPGMFGWTKSSEWVIFLFFGGVNSLTGSIIAAITLQVLPEILRFATEARIVMYTVMILLVINFRPQGLLGEWELSRRSLQALFSRRKAKAGDAT